MPETTAKTKNISLENLTTFSDQMKAKYARKDAIPTAYSPWASSANSARISASVAVVMSSAFT